MRITEPSNENDGDHWEGAFRKRTGGASDGDRLKGRFTAAYRGRCHASEAVPGALPRFQCNENLNDFNHEEVYDVDFVHNDLNGDGSLSECESIFSYG